jgi:hypothetical protein
LEPVGSLPYVQEPNIAPSLEPDEPIPRLHITFISIQFFIYLRAELNSRGPITESARNMKTNNNTTTRQNTHKEDKTKNTNTRKTRKSQKNANANKIMIPLKEIKSVYVLSSAAGGQLFKKYFNIILPLKSASPKSCIQFYRLKLAPGYLILLAMSIMTKCEHSNCYVALLNNLQ